MIAAPLEQFDSLMPFLSRAFAVETSMSNFFLANLFALAVLHTGQSLYKSEIGSSTESTIFLAPNKCQKMFWITSEFCSQALSEIETANKEKVLPALLMLFNLILFSNLLGLVPYSFSVTSQLFVTFALSFSVFAGINITTFNKHKLQIFALILPANTSFFLALVLAPLELISHLTKPISLGVRLFINLMAGHTLLKVVAGFGWSILLLDHFLPASFYYIPTAILTALYLLELGVALIQTYVFVTLTCIYMQDGN